MLKLLTLIVLMSSGMLGQTAVPVTACFTPEGGTTQCFTVQPGQTALMTVDLRFKPWPVVAIQPFPAYQLEAMQKVVDAQTYTVQKPDNTLETKRRFENVQDLYLQYVVRNIMVPALKQFPAEGENAGKQTYEILKTDLLSGIVVFPMLAFP